LRPVSENILAVFRKDAIDNRLQGAMLHTLFPGEFSPTHEKTRLAFNLPLKRGVRLRRFIHCQAIFLWLATLLIFSCAPVAAAAPDFTAQEIAYIQEHPLVRIGVVADDKPFSFQERGRIQGFSIDVINELETLTGLKFDLRIGNWSEIYSSFVRGDLDAIDAISYTEERSQFVFFTQPYHKRKTVLFARTNAQKITSLHDHQRLQPIRVGVIRNIYYQKLISEIPLVEVVEYVAYTELMKSLSLGWIDAVVASEFTGIFTAHRLNLANLQVVGPVDIAGIAEEDFRLGVLKNNPLLAQILAKAIAALEEDDLQVIEQTWLVPFASNIETDQLNLEFTPEETDYLRQKGRLRMCVDPDWMPFESIDKQGRHVGLAADFFAHFSARVDIPIQLMPTRSWEESLALARTRKCDILSLAMQTEERSAYLDFTAPYLVVPNVIASSVNEPFIDNLQQVGQRPIGSVKGYAITEQLQQQYPHLNLVEVQDDRIGIQMLQRGELYGYVGTMPSIGYQIQQQKITDIKISGRLPGDWQLAIATRNDEPILHEIFQKVVAGLAPGESEDIIRSWISVRYDQGYDYELLWKSLLVFLLVTAVMIYWFVKLKKLNWQLNEANNKLQQLSVRDALTGLYNRRYFENHGEKILNICRRNQLYFSLAIIDIDHFKVINDTHGHQLGDLWLIETGRLLQEHFQRESDTVVRYGGEEFCVFVPSADAKLLADEVEKLRLIIAEYRLPQQEGTQHVTISAGVCSRIPTSQDNLDAFVRKADEALYQAKNNGRNQIKSTL